MIIYLFLYLKYKGRTKHWTWFKYLSDIILANYSNRFLFYYAFAIIFLPYVKEEGYNDCYCQEWEISTQPNTAWKRPYI